MEKLHAKPYKYGKNNRKMTLGRIANTEAQKVQSIPIFERNGNSGTVIFKGYKYIYHR